jgi:hypothetical protein
MKPADNRFKLPENTSLLSLLLVLCSSLLAVGCSSLVVFFVFALRYYFLCTIYLAFSLPFVLFSLPLFFAPLLFALYSWLLKLLLPLFCSWLSAPWLAAICFFCSLLCALRFAQCRW